MNPKVEGFESLSGRDIFCLKNFDTFTRTSVRVSKINAVVRALLTVQVLTLIQKDIYTVWKPFHYITHSGLWWIDLEVYMIFHKCGIEHCTY